VPADHTRLVGDVSSFTPIVESELTEGRGE
jgi:hypothetical protein